MLVPTITIKHVIPDDSLVTCSSLKCAKKPLSLPCETNKLLKIL